MTLHLSLTKHHGLSNDFLVLVDLDGRVAVESRAALARAVCDRHRGIGADGLLFALPVPIGGHADVAMRLHNADGSVAEMSGNGIRCFSQAVIAAGVIGVGTVRVDLSGLFASVNSYNTKKKVLFLISGPPSTPPA